MLKRRGSTLATSDASVALCQTVWGVLPPTALLDLNHHLRQCDAVTDAASFVDCGESAVDGHC